MATITKTLQYQAEDGSYGPFDPETQTDLSLVSVLLDMDSGTYQIRIPGRWDPQDIQNTIDSEVARYESSAADAQAQIDALNQIVG